MGQKSEGKTNEKGRPWRLYNKEDALKSNWFARECVDLGLLSNAGLESVHAPNDAGRGHGG